MLRIRIRADLRCPKHPRFHPRNGIGAVKGGCTVCATLCTVYQQSERLARLIHSCERETQAACPACGLEENLLCDNLFHD